MGKEINTNSKNNVKMKKKVKLKVLPFLVFIVILLLMYLFFLMISNLPIKNIYIKGNNYLTDQEVIELAKLENYPSFIKTTGNTISKRLKKNDIVNKVKVHKKFYNQLYIEIEENKPLFINSENKVVLSNKKEIDNKEFDIPVLINYVPDTKYEDLIKKTKKIDDNIWLEVSEIIYEPTDQDKDRFGLYMNDGNLVYLTLTKFDKLNYYHEIVSEFKCNRGILNLDSGNHFEVKYNVC